MHIVSYSPFCCQPAIDNFRPGLTGGVGVTTGLSVYVIASEVWQSQSSRAPPRLLRSFRSSQRQKGADCVSLAMTMGQLPRNDKKGECHCEHLEGAWQSHSPKSKGQSKSKCPNPKTDLLWHLNFVIDLSFELWNLSFAVLGFDILRDLNR